MPPLHLLHRRHANNTTELNIPKQYKYPPILSTGHNQHLQSLISTALSWQQGPSSGPIVWHIGHAAPRTQLVTDLGAAGPKMRWVGRVGWVLHETMEARWVGQRTVWPMGGW
ncbi:hypothetical protein VC83_09228 [Pseudogymnoascus destructans]|uniref:Uncharacterized protein n=1 Tax=Pseudogymnoascus destructans TaxID=655981 RepID=A0A176ZXB7_9PEZI|nr:uncharacterized protein VC83_09228 [Pseudogymnoascus destructans]OAF54437.1 hypothetical protein VC83_09228 [Pseudogymnoascus destructans]